MQPQITGYCSRLAQRHSWSCWTWIDIEHQRILRSWHFTTQSVVLARSWTLRWNWTSWWMFQSPIDAGNHGELEQCMSATPIEIKMKRIYHSFLHILLFQASQFLLHNQASMRATWQPALKLKKKKRIIQFDRRGERNQWKAGTI